MISDRDLAKIRSRRELFLTVEKYTGVPHKALIALWGAFNTFALKSKTDTGLYGYSLKATEADLMSNLVECSRLTFEEAMKLASKGTNNLLTATFLQALELKRESVRVLYPDQDPDVVESTLSPHAIPLYRHLLEVEI